jgi:hypothetical protein
MVRARAWFYSSFTIGAISKASRIREPSKY